MSSPAVRYPVEQLLHWAALKPNATWLMQPQGGEVQKISWRQAADMVGRMATALKNQGWAPGRCIAIAGHNTAHWVLADMAIQLAGFTPVGLYPRQAGASTTWILEHCEAVAIFMGPMIGAEQFLTAIPAGVLRIALPYPAVPEGDTSWDMLCKDQLPQRSYSRPDANALATLIYTSGTTGVPKGVMLSVENIVFSSRIFRDIIPAKANERLFSYLPLAHLLERIAIEIASLYWGAEVFFLERIDLMAEQLLSAEPTRFVVVPLVLSRLQNDLTARIPESRLRSLVEMPILGRVLRKRLVSRLGLQRAIAVFSSGAQVAPATLYFFRDVLGIDVLECYGQSESLYCSLNRPGMSRIGSVGKPFADAGLRLSDEQEIQVRHPGVMLGYYKEPALTAAAFTADGWLKTGDMGRIDSDGFLYITGRIKDLFKTAKGKYVAPTPIEAALSGNNDIEQLCLVGTFLNQPVMLVSLATSSAKKPRVALERELVADMERVNLNLEDHEKIAKLLIVKGSWTVENGLLTPTLKVKRDVVELRYSEALAHATLNREELLVWL